MNRRRYRGMTAVEVVIALAIFGVLLLILTSLQVEFLRFDRDADLRMLDHPQQLAVIERLRRDVQDSISYPLLWKEWLQGETTLILRLSEAEVVVWDFEQGRAERLSWSGDDLKSRWSARGLQRFELAAAEGAPQRYGVRLRGFDGDERLVLEQVVFPRAR